MKKMLSVLLILVLVLGCFSGCGDGNSSGKGEAQWLNIVMTEDPSTLDVQKTTSEYDIPLNIFDCLVLCVTENGEPVLKPGLATSWDISDDGLVYTFHLREGVKFHNGNDFTAEDVKYTIERMMNPENECLNTWFYDMIVGANDMWEGNATEVSGVKIIDDYTVEITLDYAFGGFIANLAAIPCAMYDSEATEEAGEMFGVDPELTIGTGPFIAKEWTLNDSIKLETNPDYWQGASTLKGVKFQNIPDEEAQRMEFEEGNIDIFFASNAISQINYFKESETWGQHVLTTLEAGSYFYILNVSMDPYTDENVRKAIASAIDKQALLDTIYEGFGEVSTSMICKGILGYDPNQTGIPYDLDAAKSYLAAAGYGVDNPLEIHFMMDMGTGTEYKMNIAIQDMLKEIGINVVIDQTDDATYFQNRINHTIPVERNCWWVDYNDPDNVLYSYYSERAQEANSTGCADQWVFDTLEVARRTVDVDARLDLYRQVDAYLVDHAFYIPIFQPELNIITQPNIRNFVPSWNGWTSTCWYGVEKD